jgi:hypothetical protein
MPFSPLFIEITVNIVNKELNSYEGIPSTSLADKFEIEGE